MTEATIKLPDENRHSVRNALMRRTLLLVLVSFFLAPSALYYYFQGSRAKDLRNDPDYAADINMLSRRAQMVSILTPTPIEAPLPLPEVKGSLFFQLYSNFINAIKLYWR